MERPATTAFSTAITPADFSETTGDPNRRRWTAGKMRHVVDALGGSVVAITVDNFTGHTIVGARLDSVRKTPGYGTHEVLVVSAIGRTWYSLENLGGAIIPLDEGFSTGAKYRALEARRVEAMKAIRQAKESHPGNTRGAWTATPGLDYVDVEYRPSIGFGDRGTASNTRIMLEDLT